MNLFLNPSLDSVSSWFTVWVVFGSLLLAVVIAPPPPLVPAPPPLQALLIGEAAEKKTGL